MTARQRKRGDDGKQEASAIKVEKPGAWFAPWGPLITAGGRFLIAIAETLARFEGREYGGIPYGMCDTDSMFFVRPFDMSRGEFHHAVERIGEYFQRINPYAPIKGKEPEVFATEDINFAFTNDNGNFKLVRPKAYKPLYILSISSKRYTMANIERADGSDYDTLAELHDDWRNAVVILRKVSAHALGPITAPGYERESDDGAHRAVPFEYDADGALVLKNEKPIPLYSHICHGKGNARLFMDMWKRAFEMFIRYEGQKPGDDIERDIFADMSKWPGLDQPQFKQCSLNTWSQWQQYKNLPNRRAGLFFNILPAPVDGDGCMIGLSYDIDRYFEKTLYCQGGHDIDASQLLEDGALWWQEDNEPANNFVGQYRPYRLQTVAEAIGEYFNSHEFKTKGEFGRLERHRAVIFQREYVGKETNFLLDADLPENDEAQIEDEPEQPYFRYGFNPTLLREYFSIPDIVATVGAASPDALIDICGGYAPSSHARLVLAHLRKGTRYDALTSAIEYDNLFRDADMREREAAQLTDLARRSYKKMNAVCKEHNAKARREDLDGSPQFIEYHMDRRPIVELAAHFGLIPADNRYDGETQTAAYELLNSLMYFNGAATFLDRGVTRAQSGRELSRDEAFALFENYLGIAEYKRRSAESAQTLKAENGHYRAKRRKQNLTKVLKPIVAYYNEQDEFIQSLDPAYKDIVALICILNTIVDLQPVIRKHAYNRKTRLNLGRFVSDAVARSNDRIERIRTLARVRKQRSRANQAAQMSNSSVDSRLRRGDGVEERA
jgi:hypothetical protein